MRGPCAGALRHSGAVSDQRPCSAGAPGRRRREKRRAGGAASLRASASLGARSGANASFVTSLAHTRSQSASCSSSGSASMSASRSAQNAAPCSSRSRMATCTGSDGGSALDGGGPEPARVLAEVERHLAGAAAERPRAHPHQLAARAERVHPGGRVGAHASRQHVALPHLRRQRHALEGHERLAQTVDAGAAGGRGVHALPGRQQPRERTLLGGLHLLAQHRERRAPQPAQHLGIAPLALGAARDAARRA